MGIIPEMEMDTEMTTDRANPPALQSAELIGRCFAANDIVSLDYCSDSDGFTLIVRLLVNANDPPVGSNKDLGTARDLSRQCKREVNFCAGSEILFHDEVNATG
jgi:hypothetical protein